MKCIINGKIILEEEIVEKNIFFDEEGIKEISEREPEDEEIIDAEGMYVSPGFIDLHTHGRGGSDTMYANFDDLNNISKANVTTGCTSYLPTTITVPIDDIRKAVYAIAECMDKVEGAKILGVHLEGPFISPAHKGALAEEHIIAPTIENYKAMVGEHEDIVKKITMAPEREGALVLVKYLVEHGVSVSIGHSDASYEEAEAAVDLGANSTTHTYNAQTGLHHRQPGVVGAAMNDSRIYCELILDGKHVVWPAAKILAVMKGDHLCLITDTLECAGMPVGQYMLGDQKVWVKDGRAELANGTIAGSIVGMNEEVRNAIRHLNMSICDAVNAASRNPADSLGMSDLGRLKVGCQSDIIIFDENIDVKHSFVNGVQKL